MNRTRPALTGLNRLAFVAPAATMPRVTNGMSSDNPSHDNTPSRHTPAPASASAFSIRGIIARYCGVNLVLRIAIGLAAGIALGALWPRAAASAELAGDLFVSALKAAAPVLVFGLVASSIANHRAGARTHIRPVLVLYLLGTFCAALTAVVASFLFPSTLVLENSGHALTPPGNIGQVLRTMLLNLVDNPVNALLRGNYIGILAWAAGLGVALRHAGENTRAALRDIAQALTTFVRGIIQFAPLGILGLVAAAVAKTGFGALAGYAQLLAVLVGSMLFMALVVNPLIVAVKMRANPYPLVFTCLRESGITAFFTRSSAANIPVNLELCRKLKLHEDTYSVAIPLGATINMEGAAITVSVLTLAAAHTLHIAMDLPTAVLLCATSAVCACGAAGVAGGSLLMIPLACGVFGISHDVAMQVVGVGFIISVVQDSCETALNSSTDVLFTAAACRAHQPGSDA